MVMIEEYEGKIEVGVGQSFLLVASRFNDLIVKRLVEGAVAGFRDAGAGSDLVSLVWVPGALELAQAAARSATALAPSGIAVLGAVIRGETSHFDVVVRESAAGISWLQRTTGIPVANGVLTVDSMDQALDRAGGKAGNKGYDAAISVVKLASLYRDLDRKDGA